MKDAKKNCKSLLSAGAESQRRENKRLTYDCGLKCDSYNEEEEEANSRSGFCELNVLQSSSTAEPGKRSISVSTRIVWHSPGTLRYSSNQLQRGEYFKLTAYNTVVFSSNYAVLGYLVRNGSLYT